MKKLTPEETQEWEDLKPLLVNESAESLWQALRPDARELNSLTMTERALWAIASQLRAGRNS